MKVIMTRSNSIAPDPRVEKEARVLSAFANVTVLAWDRTGALPDEEAKYATIKRARIASGYGGVAILLKLVAFNYWLFFALLFASFDILHACDLDTGFTAMLVAKLRAKPVVYDMFDMYSEAASEILSPAALAIALIAESWVVRNAAVTIIVDEGRRKQLERMQPKQVVVIYNSPEEVPITATSTGTLENKEVFYVGVLAKNRAFEYLIEAIVSVPGVKLTIGGFGSDEAFVKAEVEKFSDRATFIGKVPYDEVLQRSATADILFALYDPRVKNHVYSSPNKLFEAMLLSKPIIVTDGTGMSDIVRRVGNGIIVEYGDAEALSQAVRRLKDSNIAEKMGARGREAYVAEFGWGIMSERLVSLYRNVSLSGGTR